MPAPYFYGGLGFARAAKTYQDLMNRPQSNPYFSYQEQEPATLPEELEPYLGSSAVAERLAQAGRDAKIQGLIGAGSAMLGAPDLLSGLGAGLNAFAEPMLAHRERARNEPVQAALGRYDVTGQEDARGMARRGEARTDQAHRIGVESDIYAAGRGRQLGEAEQMAQTEGRTLDNDFQEIINRYGHEQVMAQIEQMRAQTANTQQNTTESIELLPGRRDLLAAEAAESRDRGSYYRAGGGSGGDGATITPHSVVTDWRTALNEADRMEQEGMLPYGDDAVRLGAALRKLYEDTSFLSNPRDLAQYGPRREKVGQILRDLPKGDGTGLSNEQFKARWATDRDALALIQHTQWLVSQALE
jgi:hypothetical protein